MTSAGGRGGREGGATSVRKDVTHNRESREKHGGAGNSGITAGVMIQWLQVKDVTGSLLLSGHIRP